MFEQFMNYYMYNIKKWNSTATNPAISMEDFVCRVQYENHFCIQVLFPVFRNCIMWGTYWKWTIQGLFSFLLDGHVCV